MITISLNGEQQTMPAGSSLADLLAKFELDPKKLALELNYEIIPLTNFTSCQLHEGDKIEIVEFVGGG